MEVLLFAGLLILLCMYAALRWITQNVLPAYNHPIQDTGQDSRRVITMVTPTKTYILQQCTTMAQTGTSVQERNSNASAEIVIGRFNTLYFPKWLCWTVAQICLQAVACYTANLTSCIFHYNNLIITCLPVADLEGVPWVPWNPPFCRQLEDQPAHGTVFSQEI